MRKLLTICTALLLATGLWADTFIDVYTDPTSSNAPARANGKGLFSVITVGDGFSFGSNSLTIGTASATGTFSIATTGVPGVYIDSIHFELVSGRKADSFTSSDGTVTKKSDTEYVFKASSSNKTSVSFTVKDGGNKLRIKPINVVLVSDYEFFTKSYSISSGNISCNKTNASTDVSLTTPTSGTTASISNNGLSLGNTKQFTIASSGHNIAKVYFTCESHNKMSNISANTGTYSSNVWTAGDDTKTVTFTSSGSNAVIVGICVELATIVPKYSVTYDLNGGLYNGSETAPTQASVASGTVISLPSLTPTKTGYTFEGWTCDIDDNDYAANASYTMTAANTTFTAHWTVNSHKLTWTYPEGTTVTNPDDYTHGTVAYGTDIVAPTLTRDGFDFLGWDETPAATMPDNDLEYTAQWAPHCDASAPGVITKGTATGGTGTITLTAEGEAVDGDTWYWQTSEDGEVKTNSGSTYDVDAAGTYYIRSYNEAGDCWNGIVKSITVEAEDLLTAISPALSYSSQVIIGNTLNPTLTGNDGNGTVTYALNNVTPAGCMTIVEATGVVTAVAEGTATVTATIAANGNYKGNTATSGTIKVIRDPVGTNHTLTWTVRVNNSETTITTTDKDPTSIYLSSMSNIAVNGALTVDNSGKNGGTGKIKPTSGDKVAANCLSMTFTVADGYTFSPTNYTMSTTAVSTGKTVEVEIADTHGHSKSATWAQPKSESTPDSHNYDLSGSAYEGVVTLKIYVYNDKDAQEASVDNGYRLGSSIVLTGTVSTIHAITIDDDVDHGSVGASAATAIAGDEITLNNTADSGWKLRAYDVYKTGESATKVSVTSAGKFTMPDYPVTVSGVFAELYDITCATGLANGSVSADKDKAISGEEVTITATPEGGYQLVAIKVVETADPENDITATALEGTTLTMPAYGVTVSATFSKATGIDDIMNEVKAVKFFENGQLFIRRGDKVYTITGEVVK